MAPAITRAANARLAAVYSRDQARADDFAARHGGTATGHDQVASLLARDDVEIVYIASPNSLHAEHTLACLAAGKHVLCDKPMAMMPQPTGDVFMGGMLAPAAPALRRQRTVIAAKFQANCENGLKSPSLLRS
jgi:hypothetical protein